MSDPRYSEISRSGGGSSPIINVADSRNPMFDLALLGMLAMQFILLTIVAWKMVATPTVSEKPAEDTTKLAMLRQEKDWYRGMLMDVVDPESNNKKSLEELFEKFDSVNVENTRLKAGYDAQLVQTDQLKLRSSELTNELSSEKSAKEDLQQDYDDTRELLDEKIKQLKKLDSDDQDDSEDKANGGLEFDFANNWWWAVLGSILAALAGVFGTFFYHRRTQDDDYFADDEEPQTQIGNDELEDDEMVS